MKKYRLSIAGVWIEDVAGGILDLDGTCIESSKASAGDSAKDKIKRRLQGYVVSPDKMPLDYGIKMALTSGFAKKPLINNSGDFVTRAYHEDFPIALTTNCPGKFLEHYRVSRDMDVRVFFHRFFGDGKIWGDDDDIFKIVHGEMVDPDRRKPHPDLILEACDQIKINPDDAAGFEDSLEGLLALDSAGVGTIVCMYNENISDAEWDEIEKFKKRTDINFGIIGSFDDVQFET